MQITDHPTTGHSPATIAHANGLEFRIIDGHSTYARVARNVRQLTMADGSTWTVGQPIGWHGQEAAWKPVEAEQERAARIHRYGQSVARRDRRQLGLNITSTVTR